MPASRREVLAAAAGGLALAGCDGVLGTLGEVFGSGVPEHFTPPAGAAGDPVHHLLNRCAYGPRPGDVERVRAMGIPAWIEAQLAPAAIDDPKADFRAESFESLHWPAEEMLEWKREVVYEELARSTLLRAVYSKRQLLEVMVGFWTDHLNIAIDKDGCDLWKTRDDRDVIRPHALGRFADLIRASALSPAMLTYLDQRDNKRRREKTADQPNENYARELLELHTLGVHGGYTQADVMEVARALTGWTVKKNSGLFETRSRVRGRPYFDAHWHDDGEKVVLGQTLPAGGGEKDLDRVLAIVCAHPSTARHLATKLCRRFVADDPPAGLVARAATTFLASGGDIPAVLRTILGSEEFAAARGARVKRPFQFVVSALRALGAETNVGDPILDALTRMGQAPFRYPTPDGYPDEAAPWLGTLLWRWAFALRRGSGRIGGTSVDLEALGRAAGDTGDGTAVARHLLGRDWTTSEREAVAAVRAAAPNPRRGRAEAVAVLLASPGFQRC